MKKLTSAQLFAPPIKARKTKARHRGFLYRPSLVVVRRVGGAYAIHALRVRHRRKFAQYDVN
jgi:hypothetical protein